jgi:hypothetical protein
MSLFFLLQEEMRGGWGEGISNDDLMDDVGRALGLAGILGLKVPWTSMQEASRESSGGELGRELRLKLDIPLLVVLSIW